MEVKNARSTEGDYANIRTNRQNSKCAPENAIHLTPSELIEETKLRQQKESSVVVFGLKWTGVLKQAISELMKNHLQVDPKDNIEKVSCTKGERKLVFVKFKQISTKSEVLRQARRLRTVDNPDLKKVYINPDLTPNQQREDRALRVELKSRRQAGEKVIIRGGRIVTAREASS